MTIDVALCAYKNYELIAWCIEHNLIVDNEIRFLVVDNTPEEFKDDTFLERIEQPRVKVFEPVFDSAFDGESHGASLDFLASKAETPIFGTIDHDFFWTQPNIGEWVKEKFGKGYRAIGCAGWYSSERPDWQSVIDRYHGDRQGYMAPVAWGQFLDTEIALSDTFMCLSTEGDSGYETGWRIRQKLIENASPSIVFPGFQYPEQKGDICIFGSLFRPVGIHLLKGINRTERADFSEADYLLRKAAGYWR